MSKLSATNVGVEMERGDCKFCKISVTSESVEIECCECKCRN